MAALLTMKEKFKMIYAQYHKIILPIVKGLIACLMLIAISDKIGYNKTISSSLAIAGMTALCAFTPRMVTIMVGCAVVLIHLYALSAEVALISLAVFCVMVLVYIRFCGKDVLLLVLVPLSFYFKIPYVTPLITGILCTPSAALTLGCGVIIHYYLDYIAANAITIQGMGASASVEKIRLALNGIVQNDEMMLALISFVVATFVVYLLRRQSIDHAWSVAIFSGAMTNVILNFMGMLILDHGPSILGLLLGTIVAIPIAMVAAFLFIGADYSRTEKVQFEDEDYYYYVKAVPKMKIQAPAKTVKRINTQKYRTHHK